jgi:hypothetical protein
MSTIQSFGGAISSLLFNGSSVLAVSLQHRASTRRRSRSAEESRQDKQDVSRHEGRAQVWCIPKKSKYI